MNEVRFIDLFSGVGGIRRGLERSNQRNREFICESSSRRKDLRSVRYSSINTEWVREGGQQINKNPYFRCVWSNDFNRYANQIYTKQFGEENHYSGDIRGVNPEEIPDFDLLCAGFPCQSFSVAGKREGFQDTRGTLFFEICRIAEAKRPSLLLLENVKGLLSHDGGRTFTVILQSLVELGYWVEWQVLNSKYFGVPQNRERVFIVGHLRGTGGREIFPIGEISKMDSGTKQTSYTIDANYWKGSTPHHSIEKHVRQLIVDNGKTGSSLQSFIEADRSPKDDLVLQNVQPVQLVNINRAKKPYNPDNRQMKFKIRNDDTSYTVKSATHEFMIRKNQKIRRLTPIECERLQGFPDGWTEFGVQQTGKIIHDEGTDDEWIEYTSEPEVVRISDTQRYKCLGNAVTVNVIAFLGERILNCF